MSDEFRVWVSRRRCKKRTTYHLRWIDYTTGKWRSKAAGSDRKGAERQAARLEEQLARGTYRDVRRIAWSQFVDDHVAKIRGVRNAVEAKRTLEEFGKLMCPLGPRHVTYTQIERYVSSLREVGNEPATINKKLRYLRAAMNRAIKRGYAAQNPVDTDLFCTVEDRAPRTATDAEEETLIRIARTLYGFQMEAFILVALNTGARRSELVDLTWATVHLDDENPHIHLLQTKSHRDRLVPLNAIVVDAMRRLKARTLREGGPFTSLADNLGRRWCRLCREAGVKGLTIHDLRRTFVTRLIRAGVPLPTVQRLAGHADIKTTLRHYHWVSPDDLRSGVAKLLRDTG